MTIQTPEWVKHAVFYQIYPDRFCKSDKMVHPPHLKFKAWGSPPEEQGYQGGDLYGVIEKLDYLKDLGITALYLNPIFSSASNHRYHTYDYYQVDPLLGGNEALRALLDAAHERDMKVMLDGVFNHASRGFWQFHHILENGGDSPYIDWFTVHDYPLRPYPENGDLPINYDAWWNLPALPKFNYDNPDVQEFFLGVAKHWVDFGIDGWRMDVASEIEDHDFWRKFRTTVRESNPETYILAEIWDAAQPWLQGDQFDATMNYIFAWATMSFCGANTIRQDYDRDYMTFVPLDAPTFAQTFDEMFALYDWGINQVQFNLLDSHDTARALWILGEDESALRLCAFMQMTMPGAPCIYYGTEIGMSSPDDPCCRAAFPWHEPETWNADLRSYYQAVIQLRHENPVLRTGNYEAWYAKDQVFGFKRQLGDVHAIVFINTGDEDASISLPEGSWQPIWGDSIQQISARSGLVAIQK
jgi:neopullulanase